MTIVWDGIGNLYKSFFSNEDAISQLGLDLGGALGSTANLHIRYDSEAFAGQIRLRLIPNSLQSSVGVSGETVDLQALNALTIPLARYRSTIAGRFDVRVESFEVGPLGCGAG